jgi:hypothetical protein
VFSRFFRKNINLGYFLDPVQDELWQCCGAETIFFGSSSGSGFQKVSAPASAL